MDTLSNALSKILNAEKVGKKEIIINPTSKVIEKILEIFNEKGYVGIFEKTPGSAAPYLKLNLLGNINKCGSIRPNFSVTKLEFEKFEKRFLPAKGFGILIVSTSQGIMTHEEAFEKGIGGKLLAFVY